MVTMWLNENPSHIFNLSNSCNFFLILSAGSCLTKLYVMAFTSNKYLSTTTRGIHRVAVRVKYATKSQLLYILASPKHHLYEFKNKGTLWQYKFSDFGFPYSCIKIGDIWSVTIKFNAYSDDSWNIGSIVTLVGDTEGGYALLTTDFGVNRWVEPGKDFELTRNK